MAVLAYDDTLLREPRLLVPSQQPLGLVRVDWSHPLARGLDTVFLPSLCVSKAGSLIAMTPVGSATIGTSALGRTLKTTGGTSNYWTVSQGYPRSGTGFSTVVAFTKTSTATLEIIGLYDSNGTSSSLNGFGILNDLFREVHIGNNSGYSAWTFQDATRSNETTQVVDTTIPITNGGTYTVGGTAAWGGAANLYVNGFVKATGGPLNASSIIAPTTIRFSQCGYLTASRGFAGDVHYQFVWDRELSAQEVAAITADPYQFLIPA